MRLENFTIQTQKCGWRGQIFHTRDQRVVLQLLACLLCCTYTLKRSAFVTTADPPSHAIRKNWSEGSALGNLSCIVHLSGSLDYRHLDCKHCRVPFLRAHRSTRCFSFRQFRLLYTVKPSVHRKQCSDLTAALTPTVTAKRNYSAAPNMC